MSLFCSACGLHVPHPDTATLCREHLSELSPYPPRTAAPTEATAAASGEGAAAAATRSAPGPDPARGRDPRRCWNCGTETHALSGTVCGSPECRRPLNPPALVLRFAYGQIEVNPGERAELGRVGPHAGVFRSFPNVSRWHAVVGVDPDGGAWIKPLPTPNGTFIGGKEIPSDVRHPLKHDDRVRLALFAEGTATVYAR